MNESHRICCAFQPACKAQLTCNMCSVTFVIGYAPYFTIYSDMGLQLQVDIPKDDGKGQVNS